MYKREVLSDKTMKTIDEAITAMYKQGNIAEKTMKSVDEAVKAMDETLRRTHDKPELTARLENPCIVGIPNV